MRVFPRWMQALGRSEVVLEGVDMALHDEPENYRRVVGHIKRDALSLGGLVTSHKIDLLDAAREAFDNLGPEADFLGEVSSISKRSGLLIGHATDPQAGGESLNAIVEPGYFGRTGAEVLCFGAGGSAAALAFHLIGQPSASDRPSRMIVINRSRSRLERLRSKVETLDTDIRFEYVLNQDPQRNDEIMADLAPASLVVNATGMGKDHPGSPVTDDGLFPQNGIAWDYNYRGELDFLRQAKRQKNERALTVEDGWNYFLHGWLQVIGHVLHVAISPQQDQTLRRIATEAR